MKKIFLALALLTAVGIASYCRSETHHETTQRVFVNTPSILTIVNGMQKPTSFFVTVEYTHTNGYVSTKTIYTNELLPGQQSTLSLEKEENSENPFISVVVTTIGYEGFLADVKDLLPKTSLFYFDESGLTMAFDA